LCGIVSG